MRGVGPQRELDRDVGEAEVAVDSERELVERHALRLDLLLACRRCGRRPA